MLKLVSPDKSFVSRYETVRTNAFKAIADAPAFNPDAATGLPWAARFVDHLRSHLPVLAIGSPDRLRSQILKIEADPDFREFARYCAKRPRGKKKRGDMEALIVIVEQLFDYDDFCKDKINGAYALVCQHKQRLCPYCQMHHVNYHMAPLKKDLNLRPPLDHFYPKSKYPYLATSLFNLIPSCEQCNSRIKLARDPLAAGLVHPFEAAPLLAFESGWHSALPLRYIVDVKHFGFTFAGRSPEAQAFAGFFKLTKRYEWYDMELLDLVHKFRKHQDMPAALRNAIDSVDYALGFPASAAGQRALGSLLVDAAQRIKVHS